MAVLRGAASFHQSKRDFASLFFRIALLSYPVTVTYGSVSDRHSRAAAPLFFLRRVHQPTLEEAFKHPRLGVFFLRFQRDLQFRNPGLREDRDLPARLATLRARSIRMTSDDFRNP